MQEHLFPMQTSTSSPYHFLHKGQLSHINTSLVPEAKTAPSVCLDRFVQLHLESFKERFVGLRSYKLRVTHYKNDETVRFKRA